MTTAILLIQTRITVLRGEVAYWKNQRQQVLDNLEIKERELGKRRDEMKDLEGTLKVLQAIDTMAEGEEVHD
jgi:hypothetical protein